MANLKSVGVTAGVPNSGTGTVDSISSLMTAFSVACTQLVRPASTTAYSVNDSISNNATAGSVTALSATVSDTNDDPVIITSILVDTNDTAIGAAGIGLRVYLYNADPTASSGVVGGDNAAFSNKKNGFVATFSGTFRAFSDGGRARLVPDEGSYVIAKPTSGAKTFYVQHQILSATGNPTASTTLDTTINGQQLRA